MFLPSDARDAKGSTEVPRVARTKAEPSPHPARPDGETGGHTVQDWEQQGPIPRAQRILSDERPPAAAEEADDADVPAPAAVPIYLRPVGAAGQAQAPLPAPAFDAEAQTLAAQSGALVEALVRSIAEDLTQSLRPAVASTVAKLIPMILSFGNVPDGPRPEPASTPAAVDADPEASAAVA